MLAMLPVPKKEQIPHDRTRASITHPGPEWTDIPLPCSKEVGRNKTGGHPQLTRQRGFAPWCHRNLGHIPKSVNQVRDFRDR